MASKKMFNVLIVGAGKIGAFFDSPASPEVLSHAHAFSTHPGYNLVGFVDNNFVQAKRAAAVWGGQAFKDPAAAFKNRKIDVVVNATPDNCHFEVLSQLLNLPVRLILAEKPLTQTVRQAAEIVTLAKRKKVEIVVNYHRRFVPEFKKLAMEIKSGRYGKYLTGTGYFGKGTKHNGSHLLDLLRFLIGEIKGGQIINRDYDFTPDDPAVSAVLEFKNGRPFFMQHIDHRRYTIFEADMLFELARVRVVDSGFKIEIQKIKNNRIFKGYRNMEVDSLKNTSLDRALYFVAGDIYRHLLDKSAANRSLENGYQTMMIAANLLDSRHSRLFQGKGATWT